MSDWHVRRAVRVLRAGGVIAYPTEAVFGLGCDPMDEEAVLSLLAVKGRAPAKGLILIAADFRQLAPLLADPTAPALAPALASWPGPFTWLLPAHPHLPRWITGAHAELAARVTAHPVAAALCRRFGAPLVSTSANPSGGRAARSALAVRRHLGRRIDYLVPGDVGDARRPTEIRRLVSGRVLRRG